ncbi:MAG: hypothetical protein GY710_02375, partial [Desulfobacteraceae bacterium]|nr:hypothetical protein [Desulfobacteraceae bacterium]
ILYHRLDQPSFFKNWIIEYTGTIINGSYKDHIYSHVFNLYSIERNEYIVIDTHNHDQFKLGARDPIAYLNRFKPECFATVTQ